MLEKMPSQKPQKDPMVSFKAKDLRDPETMARAIDKHLEDPKMYDAALPKEEEDFDSIVNTLLKERAEDRASSTTTTQRSLPKLPPKRK